MKLLYVCSWNKVKEKTWSGTTYSLYEALNKKKEVQDLNVNINKIDKILLVLSSIFKITLKNGKLSVPYRFSPLREKLYKSKLNRLLKNSKKDDIVLQVGEYGICENHTYIYQDLSIDSLMYYKENKSDLFKYSNFEDYSIEYLKRRRDEQIEFYKNADGIFTMSKWLANNLVQVSNIDYKKVHWVGAGVNINIDDIKEIKKENNKILFVGRDFFRKGGDLTYEAFKILKREYMPNAELYIAGPQKWPMDDMITGVKFLGDVNSSELSKYFNMCDIFCMPSRFEAYGLVFIEALVFGLPCIARNEFEMPNFIKDGYNGFLIENDDASFLAKRMYELLNNKEIKENVLSNREEYISKYSWNGVADRMLAIINKERSKNIND